MNDHKILDSRSVLSKDLKIFILFFFLFNLIVIIATYGRPIGDFANYYYGSKFFWGGINPLEFYNDLHFFNESIRAHKSGVFFGNYAPVPPFSILFYLPLLAFNGVVAKFIFNVLALGALCFSLYRSIKQHQYFSYWFYLLPFIFFQPLYSNFIQGQAYLLIAALLLELYVALSAKRASVSGLIIALLFSLKIFPAFIVLIPFFKKDKKTIFYSLLFIIGIQFFTYLAIGHAAFFNYYFNILPRLMNNEVTEPFGYFNQSLHTLLLNLFVPQPYLNPSSYFRFPLGAVFIQAMFYSVVISLVLKMALSKPLHLSLAMALLALCLINQYNTVYGLLILLPLLFILKDLNINKLLLSATLLLIASWLPVHKLQNLPLLLQYARLWLLLLLFIVLCFEFKLRVRLRYWVPLSLAFSVTSFHFLAIDLQPRENLSGRRILYDIKLQDGELLLYSCMGYKDSLIKTKIKIHTMDSLTLLDSGQGVMMDYRQVYKSTGQIKKCFLANDSCLLVLTDEDNGVGMYRLIMKKIRI